MRKGNKSTDRVLDLVDPVLCDWPWREENTEQRKTALRKLAHEERTWLMRQEGSLPYKGHTSTESLVTSGASNAYGVDRNTTGRGRRWWVARDQLLSGCVSVTERSGLPRA